MGFLDVAKSAKPAQGAGGRGIPEFALCGGEGILEFSRMITWTTEDKITKKKKEFFSAEYKLVASAGLEASNKEGKVAPVPLGETINFFLSDDKPGEEQLKFLGLVKECLVLAVYPDGLSDDDNREEVAQALFDANAKERDALDADSPPNAGALLRVKAKVRPSYKKGETDKMVKAREWLSTENSTLRLGDEPGSPWNPAFVGPGREYDTADGWKVLGRIAQPQEMINAYLAVEGGAEILGQIVDTFPAEEAAKIRALLPA